MTALALPAVLAPSVLSAEVYVPFASNRTLGSTAYRTKVWVSNATAAAGQFKNAFMETGASGTSLQGTGPTVAVPASGSTVIGLVAPAGKIGMLEVSTAGKLVVNARLEALGANDVVLSSANLPTVSAANVIKGGTSAYLQGLEVVAPGTTTDFGVLNLSREAAQCTIKGFRSSGTQIGQSILVSLPALSHKHYDGALAPLVGADIADARLEVNCTKAFYPYAIVYASDGSKTVFVSPSQTLEGTLIASTGGGGGGGGGTNPNPTGTVTVTRPGTFFTAKTGASAMLVDIPAVPNVRYKKATVDFDLGVARFPQIPGGGVGFFSSVHSLRRNDRTLFYGLIVRNEQGRTVLDLGVTDDVALGKRDVWKERTNYHLSFVYDTVARTVTYKLTKAGQVIDSLTDRANHLDLMATDKKMFVDFGSLGIADGAYFPPMGWAYSNLSVQLIP